MKWKVSMPKDKPEPGKVHFVLAVKYGHGTRLEFAGQLTEAAVNLMMREAAGPTLLKALPRRCSVGGRGD